MRVVTPVGIELSISHLIISLKVPINSKESLVEASTAKSLNHSLPAVALILSLESDLKFRHLSQKCIKAY